MDEWCQGRRRRAPPPTSTELFPEITNRRLDGDDQPNCSAAEALDRQHPFINETLAALGMAMLSRVLRYSSIAHHGGVVNLADPVCFEIPVDLTGWAEIRGL